MSVVVRALNVQHIRVSVHIAVYMDARLGAQPSSALKHLCTSYCTSATVLLPRNECAWLRYVAYPANSSAREKKRPSDDLAAITCARINTKTPRENRDICRRRDYANDAFNRPECVYAARCGVAPIILLHSSRIRPARVSDVYSTRWLKYAFRKTGEINFAYMTRRAKRIKLSATENMCHKNITASNCTRNRWSISFCEGPRDKTL